MASHGTLQIENFGPIGRAEIPFRDITVLVGPQATGKSLALQWLKIAVDGARILGTLDDHGFNWGSGAELLGHFFGEGYQGSFVRGRTRVKFDGVELDPDALARSRKRHEEHRALYVPAHRALVVGTGWPRLFREYSSDTPFVVRDFGERVREVLSSREGASVFPAERRFREEFRAELDKALFHGGKVVARPKALGRKELRLVHRGNMQLSFMEWTTGQREVLPLLVGLYWALPAGKAGKRGDLQWVIVEEPELGLHPDGVIALLGLLLEVANRGYRLVISTHSPLVLDVIWAMQHLVGKKDGPRRLLDILRLPNQHTRFAREALQKNTSVVYLGFTGGRRKVVSQDISDLDPAAARAGEAGWGGLLEHSTRISDAVAGAGE